MMEHPRRGVCPATTLCRSCAPTLTGRTVEVKHRFPGTRAVIAAFARLETETALAVVAQLNVRFAKAMGVKLEDGDVEDPAGQDGVTMIAGADPGVAGMNRNRASPVPGRAINPC
jgi:hypothetical protein